jgi:nicotinate dehydrogenase subunit B
MQIDGNVIQGVSRTLLEEVQFDATSVKSLDWKSYPILTFQDIPAIESVRSIGRNWKHWARASRPSCRCLPQ